jgi:hypothetical protein
VKPLQVGAVAARAHMISVTSTIVKQNTMRSVLALGLLITLCAAANAATVHRPKPPGVHLRTRERLTVRPGQSITAPARFAVPGWTDEQTQYWLDNATVAAGLG